MKTEAENYDVVWGSNRLLNCQRVVQIIGKGINQQIMRFREGDDGKILFEFTVKDREGHTVAIIANSIAQFIKKGFKAEVSDEQIKVIEEATKKVWLDFKKTGPREFRLNGIFNLPGYEIEATDEYLRVNGTMIVGNTFEDCSAAIGLV